MTLTRGQETELPASAKVRFISSTGDYAQAVAEARRIAGASGRVSQADLPLVLESAQAEALAETWLFEAWAARRAGELRPAAEPAGGRAGRRRQHPRCRRAAPLPRHRRRRARRARYRGAGRRSRGLRPRHRTRAPGAHRGAGDHRPAAGGVHRSAAAAGR
ncbi:MAG: phage tail protein [Hyphomicrobium sp.]